MKECIRKWVSSLQQNPSVLVLFKNEILVCFDFNYEKVHILFSNGNVEMKNRIQDQLPDVIIKGNHDSLGKLLMGQLSLRKLLFQQRIIVQASFRKILLFEALFQLAHSDFISESSKNVLTT